MQSISHGGPWQRYGDIFMTYFFHQRFGEVIEMLHSNSVAQWNYSPSEMNRKIKCDAGDVGKNSWISGGTKHWS